MICGSTADAAWLFGPRIPAVPGDVLSLRGQLKVSVGGVRLLVQAWPCTEAGDLISGGEVNSSGVNSTANSAVVETIVAVTVPAGAAGIRLLAHTPSLPANARFEYTGIRARLGSWSTLPYRDGASTDWRWRRAAGASQSWHVSEATTVLGVAARSARAPELVLAFPSVVLVPARRGVRAPAVLPDVVLGVARCGARGPEVTSRGRLQLSAADAGRRAPGVIFDPTLGAVWRGVLGPPVRTNPRRPPEMPRLPEMRVLAQDLTTRRWVHTDLPVEGLSIVRARNASQEITGKLSAAHPDVVSAGLRPLGTRLVVEDDEGQVRGSAIIQHPFTTEGDTRDLRAAGVSSYAAQETYDSEYTSYGVDPLAVVRMLWNHILTKPGRAPLRVTVSQATSPVRIGGYAPSAASGLVAPQVQTGEQQDNVPIYRIAWWEGTRIGAEIDQLARQVPFDWAETERWNAERTDVLDHIALGWPRLGRRRTDLRFAEGENVLDHIPVRLAGADVVRVRGAGEGRLMVLGQASRPTPGRLPIVVDIQDSTVTTKTRATARAEAELRRLQVPFAVDKVLVDARHPAAPYGSYDVGDDVPVMVEDDWLGVMHLWCRIERTTLTPDEEAVAIDLTPSQIHRYGSSD